MKAPHNSCWHTAVGFPPPRSARAKSITVRRTVYERADDEEKKRETRKRARASRFSRSLPSPSPERFRERAFLVGRKLYFRSSIALVRGEYPVSRARSVDYTLELHALIGNQSFCYPLRGMPLRREHREFHDDSKFFVEHILPRC